MSKMTLGKAAEQFRAKLESEGYSIVRSNKDGMVYDTIDANFKPARLKRVGTSGGYWADVDTGLVAFPVWFKEVK